MTHHAGSHTAAKQDRHQTAGQALRPGWNWVEHEGLPEPTYWPAVLAFGITLIFWGILTSWIISGVGLIVFAVAIAGWIGDLSHDH